MGTLKHWGDMENWFGEKEAWGLNKWMSKWESRPQLLQLGVRRDCRPAISDKGGAIWRETGGIERIELAPFTFRYIRIILVVCDYSILPRWPNYPSICFRVLR